MEHVMLIQLIFFALFAGFAVYRILSGITGNRKRRERCERIAEELGFQYFETNEGLVDRLASGFKTFSQGRSRRAENTMVGESGGISVSLTDYRYTTGSGKNSTTHHMTLCVLEAEGLDLPHCFMRPQIRLFDFLGKVFGGQDIDFDEDPEFSEKWVLQGEDEAAVRKVFNESTREFFRELRKTKGFDQLQFEARGSSLVINPARRMDPEKAQELMSLAFDIFGRLQSA